MLPLDTIHARVQEFHRDLEDRKHDLVDTDLEASMLCEVSRLNLLNFLKVFEVEMEHKEQGNDHQISSEKKDDLILRLQNEVRALNDQVIALRSDKIGKVFT